MARIISRQFPVWSFFGVKMSFEAYMEAHLKRERGECPFCGRTDLQREYHNDVKHLQSCESRPKEVR